jgi:hypothetical protein
LRFNRLSACPLSPVDCRHPMELHTDARLVFIAGIQSNQNLVLVMHTHFYLVHKHNLQSITFNSDYC